LSPPLTSIPPPSPQLLTPPPQIHELTPLPPPSIAAAPRKPSEATEGKPNNHAQPEEIQSTRNGDASTTTRPEQVQVPSDHHNNPSDNTEGKQARDDTNGADLSSPSNSTNTSIRSSTPGAADNNDHSSSYGHNRTYDPGGLSNRDSRRVHDPGGNSINNKEGASHDVCDSSSNGDNLVRAVDIHHIHSRDFVRTDAVPNTASPRTFDNPPAIPYLDAKCTKMQCPLPLDFSPARASSILDAAHTFVKKDTDNNNSGNSNINAASIPDLAHIPPASRSINNHPDIKSTLEFAHVNPISDATPLRSTDTLPAILPANSRTADATQCAPSLPSLQRVSHPLDFDHARATTSDLTHTPPAPRFDNNNDDNSNSNSRSNPNINTDADNNGQSNIDATSLTSTARSLDTLDAGRTFNTSDAYIAISRNINAANSISNARTNNADADTNSSSNNNDATSILDFDTATNNSNKKRSDTVDNSSARNVVHSNEPEHECTRVARTLPVDEEPPPAIRQTQPPSSPTSIAQAHIPTHSTTPTAATAAAATSVAQAHARHTINNDAVLTNDSNNNNCSNINAVGIVNTRTPPLEVRTQIPPIVPPPPDKPEEPPPHSTRADAIDNRSTSNIVRSNEPEHERARTPPLEVPLPTNKTPSAPNSQVTQTTRPPSPVMRTPFLAYLTTRTLASLAEDPVPYRQRTTSTTNHTEKESTREGRILKTPGGVRMVHTLTSEMSPQLTKHVMRVHAPPSPSPLCPSTSTSPPCCPSSHHLQSIRHLPWFPLHFPPQTSIVAPNQHPQNQLQSLKILAGRSSKRSPPSTTVKFAFHTRHLAARGASGIEVVGGTSSASGFYSLAFVRSLVSLRS
jgi:hypothetical protein